MAKKVAKKRTKQQSGRLARQKGKKYQRDVCETIADRLGVPREEFFSAQPGTTSADATLSRAARRLFPFALETKDCKQVSMPSWLAEAEANADGMELPFALVFKLHNRRRNYIILELDEFLDWVK